jgi:hypothetical protein
MKSAQFMSSVMALTVRCRCRRLVFGLIILIMALTAGCQPTLTRPIGLENPRKGTRLWAVAPFANESGVSIVDPNRVADLFTQQLQQVGGINSVPVNRVLLAMRHLDIRSVSTPAEALALIDALGVDALVVGTVTAYDPYPPPTLGMAVQVFTAGSHRSSSSIDPQALVRSSRGDEAVPDVLGNPLRATAQAAGVFEARNHTTLAQLEQFATGRTQPDEAFGNDIYLNDMELYTQFVSFRLIHDLLAFERARLQPEEIAISR